MIEIGITQMTGLFFRCQPIPIKETTLWIFNRCCVQRINLHMLCLPFEQISPPEGN